MSPYRLIAASAAGAILSAMLGAGGSYLMVSQLDELAHARKHTYAVNTTAEAMLSDLKSAESGQRAFVLTGLESFLDPYLKARDGIQAQLQQLDRATRIDAARAQLDPLIPLVNAKLAEMAEVIALHRAGNSPAAVAKIGAGEGEKLMKAIRGHVGRLDAIEADALANAEKAADSARTTLLVVVLVAVAGLLLSSIACAFLIHREGRRLVANEKESTRRQVEANAALLASEEKLAVTLNSIGDAVIATDVEARVTLLNPMAERLTGWKRDQAIGRPVGEVLRIVDPSTREPAILPIAQALAQGTGQTMVGHTLLLARDGAEYAIADSCAPIRDSEGRVAGAVLVFRDVTEVSRFEEEIRSLSEQQRIMLDASPVMIFYKDRENRFLRVNEAMARALGTTKEAMQGKACWDIFPRAMADRYWEDDKAVILSGQPSIGIVEVIDAPQGKMHVLSDKIPYRDSHGNVIGVIGFSTDNTARKKAEAEQQMLDQRLRDQQFYTRSLIESSIDALMTTDPAGIITDVNRQMEALTGCTRDELIGSSVKNYFTDPERAEASIRQVLAEKKVINFELTARARDGRETVVSYNATTFYDRDGRLQGVFAAARDITDRKQFERALEDKNVELEHATRMKSEFLATMSHELRTPLNAIIGFSEALKDGLVGEIDATQREYIGDIFESGQHLLSLINDVLDLSKVEAGMMNLELEPADLASLLSGSLSIVKEKAAAHRIRIELEKGGELGVPQVDLRKTKQIVYNLLSNAVKFSPDGGHIVVRAKRVPRGDVGTLPGDWPVQGFPLADSDYAEFLEIAVSDDGIGISRESMAKLFRPFSQIDSRLARKYQGTGLGLAMVKQMAELHGGTVAVASAEGEGSCFAVWLPLRQAGQADATPFVVADDSFARAAAARSGERTALVVEDDDKAAELLRLLLESEGFKVLRAASGEAALAMAPQQALSLITLDIQLPGIDGWAFLERIRESGTLANVPVVIIAGLDYSNLALARGASAVMQKPISRSQMEATLGRLGLPPVRDRTHTILVVDDDPMAVEVIAAFLPAPAYSVVRAFGGAEAIALARQLRPDLIVLDLMMPDVSGFDVVEALAKSPETARIPVLVVTAKQITAADRAALGREPDEVVAIVEKAGFNRAGFVEEVRRAVAHI